MHNYIDERTNSRLRVSMLDQELTVMAEVPTNIWEGTQYTVDVSFTHHEWSEGEDGDGTRPFSVYVTDSDDWCMSYEFSDYGEAQRIFLWLVSQDCISWETLKAIEEHYVREY